jgi:hypothetical protein
MHANMKETTNMPFQPNWRLCNACKVLCYTRESGARHGRCWANKRGHGAHDFTDITYCMLMDDSSPSVEHWRLCTKCQELCYGTDSADHGNCPAGHKHNYASLSYYRARRCESDWKRCNKCQAMVSTESNPSGGPCPGGAGIENHFPPNQSPPGGARTPGQGPWQTGGVS